MKILFNLSFLLFAVFYLPGYIIRGRLREGFLYRLGFLPKGISFERPIWIHAVSLGEILALKQLIAILRKSYPHKNFVISTVTSTGNKIARHLAEKGDFVTYLPLDLSFIVDKVVDKINPAILIIAETEIWPNLITSLNQRGIPQVIVNGRISDSSYRGYSSIKWILKPIFRKIDLFCVQTDLDYRRLLSLGVPADRIRVTGNIKFDSVCNGKESFRDIDYRNLLNMQDKDKLLVCGSTHRGEEEIILQIYKELLNEFANLRLLLAPRHPERSRSVSDLISRSGFRSVPISKAPVSCASCIARPVYLLDSVGKLNYFYNIADIVFVGGSMVRKGGHNILEPAYFGKPVIFGPYMFNFRQISGLFLDNKAALLANNPEELKAGIRNMLLDERFSSDLGNKARAILLENSGASEANLKCIQAIFNG